jgi:hypothetical protein
VRLRKGQKLREEGTNGWSIYTLQLALHANGDVARWQSVEG